MYTKHDLTVDPASKISTLDESKRLLYEQFCDRFSFSLDPFQVYAIYGLLSGENVLVTVPTSCGKTIVGEFAIFDVLEKRNKILSQQEQDQSEPFDPSQLPRVIYTSPIKTLSNQKYSEFRSKFDPEQVGIMTGDIKFNPEASLLIMTTEILRDLVLRGDPMMESVQAVIFDEVHYINNEDRGYVWEESLMLLPSRIQLIMLSATMGNPEEFARWIGEIKRCTCHLVVHGVRPVKLNHQIYTPVYPGKTKGSNEPVYAEQDVLGKFACYYRDGVLNRDLYRDYSNKWRQSGDKFFLNTLVRTLESLDRCPVLFFVFSRYRCEAYARMLEMSFHDLKKQAEVERVVNWYLSQYQYKFETLKLSQQIMEIVALAKKGIGYHHASLLPFAKEVIEHLFQRQLIKVMFVTETFSVGINMPTRTVVFTDLMKNVDGKWRPLWTDEFYQMAGRAGRRGLDTEGYVVYAPLGKLLAIDEVDRMINGQPFDFKGKFSFEYQNILQHISCQHDFMIVERAFIFQGIEQRVKRERDKQREVDSNITDLRKEIEQLYLDLSENEVNHLREYLSKMEEAERIKKPQYLGAGIQVSVDQKAAKAANKQLETVKNVLRSEGLMVKGGLRKDCNRWIKIEKQLRSLETEQAGRIAFLNAPESHLRNEYHNRLDELVKTGYLTISVETASCEVGEDLSAPELTVRNRPKLTTKGYLASKIQTVDGLLLSGLILEDVFNSLEPEGLALCLITLASDLPGTDSQPETVPREVDLFIRRCQKITESLTSDLLRYDPPGIRTDLLEATTLWINGASFNETVAGISELQGNFVRTILRLVRLCEEMIKAFSELGIYLDMEVSLRTIIEKVNRDLIVFDSLYIKS